LTISVNDDLIYLYEGKPFTGVGCEYWPDGRLRSEITYVDGMEDGWSRDWYENGVLMSETQYRRGCAVGANREWQENGRLKLEERIEHGFLVESKEWNENGQLVNEYDIRNDNSNFPLLQQARQAEERQQAMKVEQ